MSRSALIIAPLAALILSSSASASARTQGEAGDVARRLNDPATQIAVTAVLASLAKSVLDMRVGELARSAGEAAGEPELRDVPPHARLRDLAGPDARRMERSIARETPRMMGRAGRMAGALDAMMPQLRDMAKQMKSALPEY